MQVICNSGGFWAPYITFVSFCVAYSGISGAIVSFIAPLAAGSGIPEIKTYLNGVHIKGTTMCWHVLPCATTLTGSTIQGAQCCVT